MVVVFAISESNDIFEIRRVEFSDEQVSSSKYITENLIMYKDRDVIVPTKFNSVIDIYLNFLRQPLDKRDRIGGLINIENSDNDKSPGIFIDILLNCFYLESYFIDESFLTCIMEKVYNVWQDFIPHISQVPDIRLFYLYVPFPLIPEEFADRVEFRRDWAKNNICKSRTIEFHNSSVQYKSSVIFYSDNNQMKELEVSQIEYHKRKSYSKKWKWNEENYLISGYPLRVETLFPYSNEAVGEQLISNIWLSETTPETKLVTHLMDLRTKLELLGLLATDTLQDEWNVFDFITSNVNTDPQPVEGATTATVSITEEAQFNQNTNGKMLDVD